MALAGDRSIVSLTLSEIGHLGSKVDTDSPVMTRSIHVDGMTLEQIADGMESFGLISDIEGAEVHFALGNSPALAKCRLLIIELHRTTVAGCIWTQDDLAASIQRQGMSLRHQDGYVYVFERP